MAILDRFKEWFGITEAPSGGAKGSVKRDPNQMIIKKVGLAMGGDQASRDFQPPEFDLTQITAAYDTEAYVRQAIDKYIELMFKAGWEFVGKNPTAVEYIKMRFALMAEATQIPVEELFIEIAEDLVKYSNAVVAKSRDQSAGALSKGLGITYQGIGGNPPIAGYFPLNVTSMQVKRDKFGTIKQWQQLPPGGDGGGGGNNKGVKFKPEDIVHFYYKREKGAAFGKPFLMPVLDDIRALRSAEENVLRLIYRNLYPFWHFQVGLPQEGLGGTDPEIDATKREIEMMDLEGGLITSERVNIKAIASDKIIDANPYLKYFEQRVFTGLGVSELMMGRGNTANRSTGDNLTGEFVDRVKAFQKVMSIFVDEFMIKELLMEGGYDPVLNPDDAVHFMFNEVDYDSKIKAENHAIFQYEHNAITEDEMRLLLGRDPITDRSKMFMNLVTIPVAEATAQLKAQAGAGSTGSNGGNQSKSKEPGTPSANNKNKPTNQHGTKPSPKKTAASLQAELFDGAITECFENLRDSLVKLVERYYDGDKTTLSEIPRYIERSKTEMSRFALHVSSDPRILTKVNILHERILGTIQSIIEDIGHGSEGKQRAVESILGTFDVLEQRLTDIVQTAYPDYISGGDDDEDNADS
jgi:hypothetical protein